MKARSASVGVGVLGLAWLMGLAVWKLRDGARGNSVPNVVPADIQAGIERHIEDQIQAGNGYFPLPFDQQQLRLKLVRVHTEYLANLGPRRHFACVDLVGTDGEVYDVDFFLAGDPGAMTVTETTVHKITPRRCRARTGPNHLPRPRHGGRQGEDRRTRPHGRGQRRQKILSVEWTHRHYVSEDEYIPSGEDIEAFLKREIAKPIICWEDSPQLGYEILPNKYFYRYQPPTPAIELLAEFWKLEKEAENLLKALAQ